MKNYLASRVFTNWIAYQGRGLPVEYVEWLRTCAAIVAAHPTVRRALESHVSTRCSQQPGAATIPMMTSWKPSARPTCSSSTSSTHRPSRGGAPLEPIPMKPALERFLRYVANRHTRSDERASTVPTTPGQLMLLRQLVAELDASGSRMR